MKRKLTLMLALLFVWTGVAWSQGVTVKGVVTSEEDGLPIVVHIPADTRSAFPVISVQSPVSIQCCWQS